MENGETGRDRVRRLLIAPLQDMGFRFKSGTPEEKASKTLNQICDDLAYMSDVSLVRLRDCLRSKGEGSARTFWPGRATILGFAEVAEPMPLEEIPKLLSWFASAAGREALMADRLVAEYEYWTRHKCPPRDDRQRRIVTQKADYYRHKYELACDRVARNVRLTPDEAAFHSWYEDRLAYVTGLLSKQEDAA